MQKIYSYVMYDQNELGRDQDIKPVILVVPGERELYLQIFNKEKNILREYLERYCPKIDTFKDKELDDNIYKFMSSVIGPHFCYPFHYYIEITKLDYHILSV